MTDFPVLDGRRPFANSELGRVIFDSFGVVEPYIEETDSWVAMPVRLVHQATSWRIEIGPYTLNEADINRLCSAIAAYDQATGGL